MNAAPKKYAVELDVLKCVAILLVMSFHYFGQLSGWHLQVVSSDWLFGFWNGVKELGLKGDVGGVLLNVVKFIEAYAFMGVNIFVFASGFGLYFSHLRDQQKAVEKGEKVSENVKYGEFFRKRLVRLLPAAVFSMVFLFFLKGLVLENWPIQNWWLNIFPFLAGLNLFSDSWFFPPINGEMWFLGMILQLYLLFPLLVRLRNFLGKRLKKVGWLSTQHSAGVFLIVLLAIVVMFRSLYYVFWQYDVSSLSYGFGLARLFEFGLGMVAAELFLQGRKLSKWWMVGFIFAFGYFFAWSFPFADALLGTATIVALWYLAANMLPKIWSKIRLATNAESKFITFVKNFSAASYMIFLIHHPMFWVLEKYGWYKPWTWFGLAVFIGFVMFIYGFARICNWVLAKLSFV